MTEEQSQRAPIGILVVHGIGAQEPGETERKLMAGLRRVGPELIVPDNGGTFTVSGQPVRLYEVYWADLLKGDITIGAFQMKELQCLSWFPWRNWRCGNYRANKCSSVKLVWWCVALPFINFLILFAYYGAGWIIDVASELFKDKEVGVGDKTKQSCVPTPANKLRKTSTLDRILDEYVGDIFSYVNSAGNAFYREKDEQPIPADVQGVYSAALQRFYGQLIKAHADGCATIQVVAHSLGTVVTYHALAGLRFDSLGREQADAILAASRTVQHVYTIGSPLEKIQFFWPRLMMEGGCLGGKKIQWDNFVSWFDPVAGMLRGFSQWGIVRNHRLLGGGFIRGHVVYEHSPVFLRALTEGLVGRSLPFTQTTSKEWWRDRLILVGETLLAPVALTVVLASGLALYVVTAVLVPYLLSLGLRLFLPAETWGPIVDTISLVFIGSMTLTFLIVPILRAGKVHSQYWAMPPSSRSASGSRGRTATHNVL
ncbi:hypothetical protein W02_08830 [Nitrospira sp. KM1]|uniref:hypothetical protein n=1 Tax=Nitrospira sp. KM1 TaxID=1936990 RepID=UPI0013A726DF|nr:hypothetical protein [Nitrospira sp. KM1]BCA53743.1 hypothetical protein W02_08830 [Nitrospira sp. KM1]